MIYVIMFLISFACGVAVGYSYSRTKLEILDRQAHHLNLEISNWKFLHRAVSKENLSKGKKLYKANLLIEKLKKQKP